MSQTEFDTRDSYRSEAELPRTAARRDAAQAQARARSQVHPPGAYSHAVPAPRAARASASFGTDNSHGTGRSRIDANGVRTIKIRGQATPPRRRPMIDASRPIARYDQHPDRAAQWALFLGVFMVVVAIVTGS